MRRYIVKQGDCLTVIASHFGFKDPMTIYNDPVNASLRRLRSNPNVLYPGDMVGIPDLQTNHVICPTGARHQFRVALPKKTVHLRLCDTDGKALLGIDYRAEVGGQVYQGMTDGTGALRFEVDARATSGTLRLAGTAPFSIKIGHLNPVTDVSDDGRSGVVERLRNLGYGPFPGGCDEASETDIETAIAQFEGDYEMPVAGRMSDALFEKLTEVHGC